MTLKQDLTSLRERLDSNAPNSLTDKLATIQLGSILRAMTTHLYNKDPAASSYNLATLEAVVLSDFAKAASIERATVRAGGVTGELAVQLFGVTPATGQIAVAPNGDIVVLAADAITALDVIYRPRKHLTKEVELPVTSGGVLTLPTGDVATEVFEAEVTVGSGAGKKIVVVPAAGAPSAGQVRLVVAKTSMTFGDAGASVNSKARVKYGIAPTYDLDAALEAISVML